MIGGRSPCPLTTPHPITVCPPAGATAHRVGTSHPRHTVGSRDLTPGHRGFAANRAPSLRDAPPGRSPASANGESYTAPKTRNANDGHSGRQQGCQLDRWWGQRQGRHRRVKALRFSAQRPSRVSLDPAQAATSIASSWTARRSLSRERIQPATRCHGSLSYHFVSAISSQSVPCNSSPRPAGSFAISPGVRTRWRWVW